MTSAKVKRSDFKTFMNTGTAQTPVWSVVGDGVTSAEIQYNPETEEETYIHQDSGTTSMTSYKPTMSVEATAMAGDPVFDKVDGFRQTRAVLSAADVDIVNVWLYETPTSGAYLAERQPASIQIDSFGGDGGGSAKINYTINYRGNPTAGTFNPTTGTFTSS